MLIVQSSEQEDMRSVQMKIITGHRFQCATTTCLPFETIATSNIRKCQMACLSEEHCRAGSFRQDTSACELLSDILGQTSNMLAEPNTTTILNILGTRNPPERTTTTTTSTTTTTTVTSTTSTTTTTVTSTTSTTTTTVTSTTSTTTTTVTSTTSTTTTTVTSTT
ncbi:unnamed protein product, partial [Adineta ricciae]